MVTITDVQREWMTLDEAAAALGCSRSTVWRRVKCELLSTIAFNGRSWFKRADVERLLRATFELQQ